MYGMAQSFLNDAVLNFFVFGRSSLTMVIKDHVVLGAHTNVVVFSKKGAWRYCWSHEVHRPFGKEVPRQCAACGCVASYDKRRVDPTSSRAPRFDISLFLVCKGCKKETLYQIPEGATWVSGKPPVANSRGDWLKVVF